MATTETDITNGINASQSAYSAWLTARTGSINAQNVAAAAAATEATRYSALTGSLVNLFRDTTLVVSTKLAAVGQDARFLLEPVFNAVVPAVTGSV